MTFIHRTIRSRYGINQTCFDLVQLAEEITEEMQLLAKEQANTFTHYGIKKTNQSGPKLN
jgi:hypothetical protein